MAVIKMKPTSPGRRGVVKISRDHLYKGDPYAPLLEPQFQKAGRNNNGHITTRHKGGGHKHHYRVVDFRRNKDGIAAKVERIEYDPNRSAHIALVCYADGERSYIIAPRGLEVGASIMSGAEAPIRVGNTLPIRNIPVGSVVHCIELQIGKGAQIVRSAGTSATLLAPSVTFVENIWRQFFPRISDKQELRTMRAAVLIFSVCVCTYAIALQGTPIYEMVSGAYQVPLVGAFVPLTFGLYWKRATTQGAIFALTFGLLTWGLFLATPAGDEFPAQLAGVLASLTGMVLGSLGPQAIRNAHSGHHKLVGAA